MTTTEQKVRDRAGWETVLSKIGKGYVPAGGKEKVYDSGVSCMARLKALGAWKDGDTIVDIGCGNGRLAIPLAELDVRYFGIDTIAESIGFCHQAFAEWSDRFHFEFCDVKNDFYNLYGKIAPDEFEVRHEDGSVDTVFLSSVLTHIGTESACERYLQESYRILRPSGKLYVTWFRSPPNEVSNSCERTVFPESFILNLVKGFTVEHTWGGLTQDYNDQWAMILRKNG